MSGGRASTESPLLGPTWLAGWLSEAAFKNISVFSLLLLQSGFFRFIFDRVINLHYAGAGEEWKVEE